MLHITYQMRQRGDCLFSEDEFTCNLICCLVSTGGIIFPHWELFLLLLILLFSIFTLSLSQVLFSTVFTKCPSCISEQSSLGNAVTECEMKWNTSSRFKHSPKVECESRCDPSEAAAGCRLHVKSLLRFASFNEGVRGRLHDQEGSHLHRSFRCTSAQVSPPALESKTSDQSELTEQRK